MSKTKYKGNYMSLFAMLLITLLVIGLAVYLMPTVHAAEGDVTAWTTSGTCEWGIDQDGCLWIRPSNGISGTLEAWDDYPAWHERKFDVESVIVKSEVKAVTCAGMFEGMWDCQSMDLSGLNTSAPISMREMFKDCDQIEHIDLSWFDTSNVTDMTSMFSNCMNLVGLDASGFDTSNVVDMSTMFSGCSSLTSLDVSSFNTSRVTDMSHMFDSCDSLSCVKLGQSFMFDGAGIADDYYKAMLNEPTGAAYTGKWILKNDTAGASAMTPEEMRDAGTVTPGTWVWQVRPDPNKASFDATLVLNQNASVPNATITFTAAPGVGMAAVPGTSLAVLAPTAENGVSGNPTIGAAAFAAGDETVTEVNGVTIAANQKAVVKPVAVDFNGVTFAQPGIFRYLITEPSTGSGLTYDTQLGDTGNGVRYQRVLDVYVQRVDDADTGATSYQIGGYVFHEVANAPAVSATAAADKSSGFVHEYDTKTVTLESRAAGNQSSIDKYFAYTITIQNPNDGAFTVSADWTNAADALNPTANPATKYDTTTIAAANTSEWTANADGSLSKTIYLRNGQKVALDGIPAGATYAISVADEDYSPSWAIGSDNGETNATGNRVLNALEDVVFTLTRDGVVPTGVMLSAVPGLIIMSGALVAIITMRKRKEGKAEA